MLTEEEKQCERNIKLYQLIYDREVDKYIDDDMIEISKLGVDINFRDLNRKNKTGMHLAVANNDLICVKFLMQFTPNLSLKDEDGHTPLELAELSGFKNIVTTIGFGAADVIDESLVVVIEYNDFLVQGIEEIKLKSSVKVLRVINCTNLKTLWNRMRDSDYSKVLNDFSHFFILVIETNQTFFRNDMGSMSIALNTRNRRPMVVQLLYRKKNLTYPEDMNLKRDETMLLYYKENCKNFTEILVKPKITVDEFNSENMCNMQLLVTALRSNLFGSFTGSLLDVRLDISIERSAALDKFACSNALCHRFLMLFSQHRLPRLDTILASLTFNGDESFKALLDFPFDSKNKLVKNKYQEDVLNSIDQAGRNLLMIAIELRNLPAVKLILRAGFDPNYSDKAGNHVFDICWTSRDYRCFAELILYDSRYPKDFDITQVFGDNVAYAQLEAISEDIKKFHLSIGQGHMDEVKQWIFCHPAIKHGYDHNNKCALSVALNAKKAEIFSLLQSKGYQSDGDDGFVEAWNKCDIKKAIRNSNRMFFKSVQVEFYLERLVKSSKLSFKSEGRRKCSTAIRKMFYALSEIEELVPILKLCSLCTDLMITFDFSSDIVSEMDPSRMDPSRVELGLTYASGFIYVGAKNHETDFYDAISNLIHELAHYAMIVAYKNKFKPYAAGNEVNANRFQKIVDDVEKVCMENPMFEPIFTNAFTIYSKKCWHGELIVRVPEVFAYHHSDDHTDDFATVQLKFKELFCFYREETLKDIEVKIKELENKFDYHSMI